MKHRKLRIAWSVAWGVVAVLLVSLWVRSYWIADSLQLNKPYFRSACAFRGNLYYSDSFATSYTFPLYSSATVLPTAQVRYALDEPHTRLVVLVIGGSPRGYRFFGVPLWVPTTIAMIVFLLSVRALRRGQPGHCLRCGYDLRATPDRCPECGSVKGLSPQAIPAEDRCSIEPNSLHLRGSTHDQNESQC